MNFKTEENKKKWVETCFLILVKNCGFPKSPGEQIIINNNYFDKTFSSKKFELENVFEDLISILDLNNKKISFEITFDLRDSGTVPVASIGNVVEIEVANPEENEYCFYISNSLQNTQKKIIYKLIIEFIRIKLTTYKLFKEEKNISEHFLFLAGIYFGFGLILFENRMEVGTTRINFWKKQWRFLSPVLPENIAYSFAFYEKLFPSLNLHWIKNLPKEFQKKISEHLAILNSNSNLNTLINDSKSGDKEFNDEMIQNSIKNYQENKVLSTKENNIGYRKLKEGFVEEGENYFRESLKLYGNSGYANDNLGYALILQGKLDEGFNYLQNAIKTEKNNFGYSSRNLGLYYHKKGDLQEAKKHFELAFSNEDIPIDFLEFHYSELLSEIGDKENALKFLEKSKAKGEEMATEKFKSLN